MAVETSIPPRRSPRWALVTAMVGLLAVCLAAGALRQAIGSGADDGISPPASAESGDRSFRELSRLAEVLYSAVALVGLSPPSASEDVDLAAAEPWLGLARVFALGFIGCGSLTLLTSLRAVRVRWVRLRFWKDHFFGRRDIVVVCGLGPIGRRILGDLRHAKRPDAAGRPHPPNVIAIDADPQRPGIDVATRLEALTVVGDPLDPAVRRWAMLERARTVYVATGDDATDLTIASHLISDLRAKDGDGLVRVPGAPPLECLVHLDDIEFVRALSGHVLSPSGSIRVKLFSPREDAARMLLLDDRSGLASVYPPARDQAAHYFVFGFGPTGTSVTLQLARLAHFSNLRRPRITILDDFVGCESARTARARFTAQYPAFSPGVDLAKHAAAVDDRKDCWDHRAGPIDSHWAVDDEYAVEYVAHAEFLDTPAGTDSPALLSAIAERLSPGQSPPVRPALLVCFEDEGRNVRTALRLRRLLQALPAASLPEVTPIFVYTMERRGAGTLLWSQGQDPRMPIHPFGRGGPRDKYQTRTRARVERVARELHEAYRKLAAPDAERDFDALPPLLRASNEEAAVHALVKLMSVGYRFPDDDSDTGDAEAGWDQAELGRDATLPNEEASRLAQAEHNRWMAERLLSGWRYEEGGEWSDLTRRRRRPALRPWTKLADDERRKDEEQIRALLPALRAAGVRITRSRNGGPAA